MKTHSIYLLLFMISVLYSSSVKAFHSPADNMGFGADIALQDTLHLQSDELRLVVVNNEAYGELHRAGYNGISELYPNGSDRNFFRPDVAGMNYEFILNGDASTFDYDLFEPRVAPMQISRLSENKVLLEQPRTENWPLQSAITFELTGNLVEMSYEGIPLADIGGKYGYIGLFFASYIRGPEEKGINFIGRNRADTENTEGQWIYHLPSAHGVDANHRPAGVDWDPEFDEDFPVRLASGISDLEYIYPFYYGISGDYVLIKMFERPTEHDEMRLAQSPTGGGPENPAWDFLYYNKNPVVGESFRFRAALVVKKFEGIGDVIDQYEKWSGETVTCCR
ncbi:MAG: hypothetical protein JJU13_11100 [Balneolaceae bacterium]|nr:hypothetical protein [Balneolaceae bacterium]